MSRGADGSRPAREVALAALFFLAYTVLATWPQSVHLGDAMADLWDAKFCARILHWDYLATRTNLRELFHVPFFHPARYVLAFSENLYGVSIFGFPLLAAGASALQNYNVLFLLGMFLSALAAWALAREWTGDPAASLVAGLVFAFLPWRISQIPHIQFQWGAFLALLFLFLVRYLEKGRRADAVLFSVAFGWNALANVHYALFSGFLVAVILALHAASLDGDRWRRIRGAVLAAALGAAVFLPFAVGYRRAAGIYKMQRFYGEMEAFSGRWTDFLSAGEKNRFWGPLTQKWQHAEGDFFPGVVTFALAVAAVATIRRAPIPSSARDASPGRLRAARWLDALSLVLVAVWLASALIPGLHLGPLSVGDPGRVQVLLTVVVLARLVLAFPGRPAYASLPDLLRRSRFPPRLVLLVTVAAVGVVIALGAHTPYYRFLFKSFGDVFRAIRAPARGIVLFDLALAVLAAWGLSRLTRERRATVRIAAVALALLLVGLEYRAFPLRLHDYDAAAAPVYRWIAQRTLPGGVVELPLGPRDAEYLFRQTEHGRPLVNGYSGFFPPLYLRLQESLRENPIPEAVWERLAESDAALLVLHVDETNPLDLLRHVRFLRGAVAQGRVRPLGAFAHGGARDLVFRLASAPEFATNLPPGASADVSRFLDQTDASLAPPFAGIEFSAPVSAGEWHGGWALDDSGIAEIRVASEVGPAGGALLHMYHPGLAAAFPDYAEAANDHAGFGFAIPRLAPGPHALTFTVIANDGGITVISRRIVVK